MSLRGGTTKQFACGFGLFTFVLVRFIRAYLLRRDRYSRYARVFYFRNTGVVSASAIGADEIELNTLAAHILQNRPIQGFLTISPALQWRLQYKRVIDKAGSVEGIDSVYKGGLA